MDYEIKKYIDEAVKKSIDDYINNIIMEYALPRKVFMKQIENILPQFITHWCLIKYAKLSNTNIEVINHWKRELLNWLYNMSKLSMKGKDNIDVRKKAIYEVFDILDLNSDPLAVKFTIISKFEDENIDINNNIIVDDVITQCINETEIFIHLIANKNIQDIKNYVKSL